MVNFHMTLILELYLILYNFSNGNHFHVIKGLQKLILVVHSAEYGGDPLRAELRQNIKVYLKSKLIKIKSSKLKKLAFGYTTFSPTTSHGSTNSISRTHNSKNNSNNHFKSDTGNTLIAMMPSIIQIIILNMITGPLPAIL